MEFRLATKADLAPGLCQALLNDAIEYAKENPADRLTPWEILNIFINFCEGRITDPQFWIGLRDGKLLGYMITMAVIDNKETALSIRQGYIEPQFRNNGVAGFCLETLEKKAKAGGYKSVVCQTYFEPKSYGRWISRYGYSYKATEFKKEL